MSGTVRVGQYSRRVAHGLGNGLRALIVHLLSSNYRDRLGCLHQGHAGLGRHLAVRGVVTLHAAQCVAEGETTDVGVW
ncbi:hypothetical protein D3C80_1220880 [compost metagenome]